MREEVEDAAADGVLAAGGDGGLSFVGVCFEGLSEGCGVEDGVGFEGEAVGEECGGGGGVLGE